MSSVTPVTIEETIVWHSPDDHPDVETTVLVFHPDADEPIDFGFWDGERWVCAGWDPGMDTTVRGWAHLPAGAAPDYDPTPWCSYCGARTKERCHCGPMADND